MLQAWASHNFSNATGSQPIAAVPPVTGQWLGRLEIPRLNVSAMVREGDDNSTLRFAVGHIPGTALPGQSGTVALAGHRDSFFRALRGIRKGDRIRFQSVSGDFEYSVEDIQIVSPTQLEVLQGDGGQSLSLITCYPFTFVGSAPQRFVVRARETKLTPDSTD